MNSSASSCAVTILRFDDSKMWQLDLFRGQDGRSPLLDLRAMAPAEREKHIADYRAGFTIKPI